MAHADPRIDEALQSLNEELADRAIRHSIFLERFKAGEVRRILAFLNTQVFPDLLRIVRERLERIDARGFDIGPSVTGRLQTMLASVDELLRRRYREARDGLFATLEEVGSTESRWQIARMGEAMPIEWEFNAPSPETLRSIVRSRPMQGRVLREWWSTVEDNTKRVVREQINIGLAEGETVDQIVRRLRGTRANRFRDGVLQMPRRQIEATVRTAINHTVTNAREQVYAANADLVKGVQYVATLDSRTTLTCASLDGEVFDVGTGPRPPQHFACRSTTTPVLKSWRELGIPLSEAPEGTRSSMDGQVAGNLTYGEWLRRQPRAVVEEALGPERARLFLDEGVAIDRFVDPRNRPLTLAELARKEGL